MAFPPVCVSASVHVSCTCGECAHTRTVYVCRGGGSSWWVHSGGFLSLPDPRLGKGHPPNFPTSPPPTPTPVWIQVLDPLVGLVSDFRLLLHTGAIVLEVGGMVIFANADKQL